MGRVGDDIDRATGRKSQHRGAGRILATIGTPEDLG
jgi:hypothetical protein